MHDPFFDHDEISKVSSFPCNVAPAKEHGDGHNEESHTHGRVRPGHVHDHGHDHAHGEHVHDGRPHVHMPDGTVRYLEEGELPSAPKRRRSPTQEQQ